MTDAPTIGLRARIETACEQTGRTMSSFDVLAPQHEPYRQDTPANHRNGKWFAEHCRKALLLSGASTIHIRGIHYAIVAAGDVMKPHGVPYRNTDGDYQWLADFAAKSARWLGYIDFDTITDAKNEAPVIRLRAAPTVSTPQSHVSSGVSVSPPGLVVEPPRIWIDRPRASLFGFNAKQPYHFVFFGEKTSLTAVLDPIAGYYNADLYLPTGEISDTLVYQMAQAGAASGRRMIVFTVCDYDPGGHQMSVSIARKLQAFRDLFFPSLAFEVRPIALTGDQARSLNLPSTPLKAKELRASKWRQATGREQTEVDALATLQPDVLRRIIHEAVAPFYDRNLNKRISSIETEWERQAQEQVDRDFNGAEVEAKKAAADQRIAEMANELEEIEAEADQRIAEITDELEEIEAGLKEVFGDVKITIPVPDIPLPEIDEDAQPRPLISSTWTWIEQTAALKARKAYAEPGDDPDAADAAEAAE